MALFNRKTKDQGASASADDALTPSRPEKAKERGAKKRRPHTLLSSVVQESATGAAIDALKQNSGFVLPNSKAFAGLLLNVDAIGGLSEKQKNDEAKGSIIELITADKIQVVATREMLDKEFLGIIPSQGTLDRMREYSLLTAAPYHWCIFRIDDSSGQIVVDSFGETSYAEAVDVEQGIKPLSAVLPEAWAWAAGAEAPADVPESTEFDRILAGAPATASVGGAATAGTVTMDSDPMAGAFDFSDSPLGTEGDLGELSEDTAFDTSALLSEDDAAPLPIDMSQFEAQLAETAEQPEAEDETPLDLSWQNDHAATEAVDSDGESEDAGYFRYLEVNEDRVVDEAEVRDTIVRRFLSDDLDLVVDTEEFDRVFNTEAEAILIEIPEGQTGWLGDQVQQLARQANAALAQLHKAHTDELREIFVETTALHVEKTMTVLSTETPGSQYANLLDGAKRDFDARRADGPAELAAQRRELEERFEAQVQARVEQAAAQARVTYENKHRPKLERDIADLGLDFDRRLEEQHAHDRSIVLDMRRRDAQVRMEIGTNRIFEHIREVQAQHRVAEQELLASWNMRLVKFIDENRKNDLTRAAVLADELLRNDAVAQQRREFHEAQRVAREDSNERERRLQEELRTMREDALRQLEERRHQYEGSLSLERDRVTQANATTEALRQQLTEQGQRYTDQYQARISQLEEDKRALESSIKQQNKLQKNWLRVVALLAGVLTVAGIAVGIIAGWAWAQTQFASLAATEGLAAVGTFLI